jgi:NAD(P)-dependent dehydrogenase (short-subunit alcohol dehydrogenase family)
MTETEDLRGKTVLLTGASGGIGSATARALLERGADLVAHYGKDREGALRACADAPEERWHLVQADLTEPGASRVLWRDALAWRERIDVVVVNAAVSHETPIAGSDEQWDEGWEQTLRVNVLEPASLVREAVRHFLEHGGGSLITLSSWAAEQGSAIPQLTAYASSKAAVRTLTQTIARSHARDGILAYVVAPGIVRTPMSEISATHRGGIDAVNAALAMGEMAQPEEVGRLIAFLAAGTVPNLTGATLDVNGASYVR